MAEVQLRVEKRDGTGKGAARRSRASGRIPGVVYGRGMEPVAVSVDRREFLTALNTEAGVNVLLDLQLDGDTVLTLARELQRDPVRGTLLHADFVKIDRSVAVEVEVPVNVVGEAPGVKEGGVLETQTTLLQVRCLPTDVPESIAVDISNLAIGDSTYVSDIPPAEKYEIVTDAETVIVHIAAPVSEAELEAMEAAAGVVTETPEEAAEEEPGAEERADAEEEQTPAETPAEEG